MIRETDVRQVMYFIKNVVAIGHITKWNAIKLSGAWNGTWWSMLGLRGGSDDYREGITCFADPDEAKFAARKLVKEELLSLRAEADHLQELLNDPDFPKIEER